MELDFILVKNVTIKFSPAPHDVGYCFVRDDLEGLQKLKLIFNGFMILKEALILTKMG